ncbi:GAF domain-containing hybrid sensor histidine kinase/response regulator [Pseudobacteriovorax antillogorgiicola]|uniref:histidine kinase n=1 Tax=Pseudobacteriovorax antillogorgiicola TaxID=1513793 RepID=A0A1Y6CE45_9BACT|nr:GAF domain-containing hybrid sensor histidine kinase/response regulator [Pseudobacteriovorax antillogorgiicola]TCS51723.1 GAF domain-containing protein [Pseudobacteriovorax antillogorgiicola]SMF49451.1 GAF domain-containing protein [Pseudobacteriovorax antillogorgiicola]
MKKAPLPENEEPRIKLLQDLRILDSELEKTYDDITKLAARICGVPICLVSLVDEDRQWFKSHHGLEARETPRDFAFCAHAILGDEVFEVPDARKDERFSDNPLVTDNPNVIFYAGYPLEMENDLKLGTLCVIDHQPKVLTEDQRDALKSLSSQVITLFKLRRSNYRLQTALENKANMLSTMSHEIRTPLNGVLGMTELLLDTELEPRQKEMLETVRDCGHGLITILNDILDFSKLEIGKVELHAEAFDLPKTIQNSLYLFESNAASKGLSLEYKSLDGTPELVMGDEYRLRQVLQNLISNALKFTEQGGVTVESTGRKVEDGCEVTIKVADTGMGIAKDAQVKLFQSFSQTDASIARKYGGTGLGLAISKNLVELMRGRIEVSSELGKGTTFTIVIPFEKADGLAETTEGEQEEIDVSDLAILVAEDNGVNQVIAKSMLEALGATIDLVEDGQHAVEAARTKSYDLVFMDCHMPGMDGYAATRTIKDDLGNNAPYVVALTASSTEDDQKRCRDAGMDDFMSKPISKKNLRAFFRKFLNSKQAA